MEGSKIIKISTPAQFEKLVELMEKKPYLAKGYHKSLYKINIKEEWNQIAEELNTIGPPCRSSEGWMKVWADFKFKLKKKLSHNKAESHATGGGSFKQFILSPVEEAAVSLLDMRSVIEHRDSFGLKRPSNISPSPQPIITTDNSCDDIEEPCTSSASKKITKNKAKEKLHFKRNKCKFKNNYV